MKTHIPSVVAALAAASLATAATALAQTPPSPTGVMWDCLISDAGQKGIAFITFGDDFKFQGYQILVGSHPSSSIDITDRRNLGIEVGRNLGDTEGGTNQVTTNFFGMAALDGMWAYDYRGNLVGNSQYFAEKYATDTN